MKKILGHKLAKEAQRELHRRLENKRIVEQRIKDEEEQKKSAEAAAAMQFDDILPLESNNALQKMGSISAILNDPLNPNPEAPLIMGQFFPEEENFYN
jgi:ERCC4-type nuclease